MDEGGIGNGWVVYLEKGFETVEFNFPEVGSGSVAAFLMRCQ